MLTRILIAIFFIAGGITMIVELMTAKAMILPNWTVWLLVAASFWASLDNLFAAFQIGIYRRKQ